jgi:anti-sigma factor RsiW
MHRSQKRVTEDAQLLLRYVDGEMSPGEAQKFRARLAESPALRQKLQEMRRVGALVRLWASGVERRAEALVEPTLLRVHAAQRRSVRVATLSYALAALLVVALPWSQRAPELAAPAPPSQKLMPAGAAIERIEAGDTQAQVFLVGTSSTPVVWLADDAQDDDDDPHEQDPG